VIIKGPSGKFYAYDYDKGLTENQDNEYYTDDVYQVEKFEKVVTTTVWKTVKDEQGTN
jgi:hypothetical protein